MNLAALVEYAIGVGQGCPKRRSLRTGNCKGSGHYLGLELVSLIHLFNPQAIVLGGSVTLLGDLILDPAKEIIHQNLLDTAFYDENLIRLTALGDDVCLYGAAYYAKIRE